MTTSLAKASWILRSTDRHNFRPRMSREAARCSILSTKHLDPADELLIEQISTASSDFSGLSICDEVDHILSTAL